MFRVFIGLWSAHRLLLLHAGLLALLLLLLVYRLGNPALHIWDEARLAVNASEILRSHDWLVMRYDGRPDLWNTKPPLLIWLQAVSLQLLGYTAWAVRLPSAAAAVGTCWLLYRFGLRVVASRWVGVMAALILATSPGFNGIHVARTGDYDSLLTLGLTGFSFAWYQYLQARKPVYLVQASIWLAAALLVKSAAALLVLPGVAFYCLLRPAARWVLVRWQTYCAGVAACLPLLLFYALREAAAPGYLAAVWFNDWYRRLTQHIVDVRYPWWIYLSRLMFPGLLAWVALLPGSVYLALRPGPDTPPRAEVARYALVYVGLFLLLISLAKTRLPWYAAPMYPMLALLCALGLEQAMLRIRHWPVRARVALLGLAVLAPAGVVLQHEWQRPVVERQDPQLRYGYIKPLLAALRPSGSVFYILQERRYNGALDFQLIALRRQGFRPVLLTATETVVGGLQVGQKVLVCSEAVRQLVDARYYSRPLGPEPAPCQLLEIERLR